MRAKLERRKTELYAMDLVWMIARHYYEIPTPMPSKSELDHRPADTRSAKEIKDEMLRKAQEL